MSWTVGLTIIGHKRCLIHDNITSVLKKKKNEGIRQLLTFFLNWINKVTSVEGATQLLLKHIRCLKDLTLGISFHTWGSSCEQIYVTEYLLKGKWEPNHKGSLGPKQLHEWSRFGFQEHYFFLLNEQNCWSRSLTWYFSIIWKKITIGYATIDLLNLFYAVQISSFVMMWPETRSIKTTQEPDPEVIISCALEK